MKATISSIVVLICIATAAFGSPAKTPRDLFENYRSALTDGRYADAENCWDLSTIEASKRLGITYDNIAAKYDCASPLVTLLPEVRSGLITASVDTTIDKPDYSEVSLRLSTARDTSICRYFAVQSADGWKLISALQSLTADWKIHETKYVRLFYSDSTLINDYACTKLDRFIENIGRRLGLTDDDFALLQKEKIYYYLCNEGQIKEITGYNTQGMADLPLDAVVSRQFPHWHELTHLLVNFAEKHIPLYTIPFLQEGTASYFGGRWGRSPKTIMYTGAALIRNGINDVGDVLSYNDFHVTVGVPDISYPLSAIIVDRLLTRMNPQDFLDLYRLFSGSLDDVRAFTKEEVMAIVGKYCGATWDDIADDCRRFVDSMTICGIKPCEEPPAAAPVSEVSDMGNELHVRIWEDSDDYQFEISASDSVHSGILLISDDENDSTAYISRLFSQHAPGETYRGEPFGIKFTEAEVSCYDYLCDELTGIYVPGFAGTIELPAPNLWDASDRTYRFAVEKALVPPGDPSKWLMQIIPL